MTREGNVVSIADRFNEPPPIAVPRDIMACNHEHIGIDEKLRTVMCVDCRQERLDPLECLITMARQWHRWKREADALRKLRVEHRQHERDVWERARDRHLNANPTHSIDLTKTHWTRAEEHCRTCSRLELTAPQDVRAEARGDKAFDQKHALPTERGEDGAR